MKVVDFNACFFEASLFFMHEVYGDEDLALSKGTKLKTRKKQLRKDELIIIIFPIPLVTLSFMPFSYFLNFSVRLFPSFIYPHAPYQPSASLPCLNVLKNSEWIKYLFPDSKTKHILSVSSSTLNDEKLNL